MSLVRKVETVICFVIQKYTSVIVYLLAVAVITGYRVAMLLGGVVQRASF